MDCLKTLRSFSWNAVDKQANELFESIRNAQGSGLTSIEYFGVIHAVNVEILKANGFNLAVNYNPPHGPRSVTVSWSPFIDTNMQQHGDEVTDLTSSDIDDDEEEECCLRRCCPCDDKKDNIKNLVISLLSSLGENKK